VSYKPSSLFRLIEELNRDIFLPHIQRPFVWEEDQMLRLLSLLREEKHFWIQELDGVANEYPYDRILDIFVRVNSGGTKLDASDLMFAAMKEAWSDIEEVIEQTTEMLNGTNLQFDKTFPLKCLLVAHGRGAEASPEKFTGSDGDALMTAINTGWAKAEQAFQELRDFLKNDLKIYADKVTILTPALQSRWPRLRF
jgi:hypothetical protein